VDYRELRAILSFYYSETGQYEIAIIVAYGLDNPLNEVYEELQKRRRMQVMVNTSIIEFRNNLDIDWNDFCDYFKRYWSTVRTNFKEDYDGFFSSFYSTIEMIIHYCGWEHWLTEDDFTYNVLQEFENISCKYELLCYLKTLCVDKTVGDYDKDKLRDFKVEDIYSAYQKVLEDFILNNKEAETEKFACVIKDIGERSRRELKDWKLEPEKVEWLEDIRDILLNLIEQKENLYNYFTANNDGKEEVMKRISLDLGNPLDELNKLNILHDISLNEEDVIEIIHNKDIYEKYFVLNKEKERER